MDWMDDFEGDNGLYAASFANSAKRTEPEEYPFRGEVLPPSFLRGAAEFHAHEAFDELARVYGREQAARIWREIPEEHRRD